MLIWKGVIIIKEIFIDVGVVNEGQLGTQIQYYALIDQLKKSPKVRAWTWDNTS